MVDPEVDDHAATQCDGGELHRVDLVERLQNAITSRARAQAQQHARGTFRTVLVDDYSSDSEDEAESDDLENGDEDFNDETIGSEARWKNPSSDDETDREDDQTFNPELGARDRLYARFLHDVMQLGQCVADHY